MPLLDHFRPPIGDERGRNSFHSNWATRIADQISDVLPEDFLVEENAKGSGLVEIDVATLRPSSETGANGTPPDRWHSGWQPPAPDGRMPIVFPDQFEVLVYEFSGGRHLVGVIELVSPGNKDRPETREAFASKVANYLHLGASVIVIDVVTSRRGILHNDVMRVIGGAADLSLPADTAQYAVSYRPALRDNVPELDLWFARFAVGDQLPTMPLRLVADYFLPIDFEAAYTEALRRRRLI